MTSCDLLRACVKLKEDIPINLVFIHVKGHQDDHEAYHKLSLPSQLNILMDGLVKDLLHSTTQQPQFELHRLSFSLPSISNTIINENIKNNLYKYITTKKAHKHWTQK